MSCQIFVGRIRESIYHKQVLYAEILDDFETGTYLAATKLGQIKRFERKEFTPWRTYKSKSVKYAKLKDWTINHIGLISEH